MFRFAKQLTSVNVAIDESVRASDINNPGFSFSTTDTSCPQATADSSLEKKEALFCKYNFEQKLKTEVSTVDKKVGYFQRHFTS